MIHIMYLTPLWPLLSSLKKIRFTRGYADPRQSETPPPGTYYVLYVPQTEHPFVPADAWKVAPKSKFQSRSYPTVGTPNKCSSELEIGTRNRWQSYIPKPMGVGQGGLHRVGWQGSRQPPAPLEHGDSIEISKWRFPTFAPMQRCRHPMEGSNDYNHEHEPDNPDCRCTCRWHGAGDSTGGSAGR